MTILPGAFSAGGAAAADSGSPVPPDEATVVEGTVTSGMPGNTHACEDSTYWVVQETASGIDIQFSFLAASGNATKFKVRGKSDASKSYSFQAWNGTGWDNLKDVNFSTEDQLYSVDLDGSYTINGRIRTRIYRSSGTTDKLHMDCIYTLAPVSGDTEPAQRLLYSQTLTAGAEFDISSIPQTYDDLVIYLTIRGEVASTAQLFNIFFNTDTTLTNYWYHYHMNSGGTATFRARASGSLGIYCPGSTSAADQFSSTLIWIPEYADNATYEKLAYCFNGMIRAAGVNTEYASICRWETSTTDAINRIRINTQNAPSEIEVATVLDLYGVSHG